VNESIKGQGEGTNQRSVNQEAGAKPRTSGPGPVLPKFWKKSQEEEEKERILSTSMIYNPVSLTDDNFPTNPGHKTSTTRSAFPFV